MLGLNRNLLMLAALVLALPATANAQYMNFGFRFGFNHGCGNPGGCGQAAAPAPVMPAFGGIGAGLNFGASVMATPWVPMAAPAAPCVGCGIPTTSLPMTSVSSQPVVERIPVTTYRDVEVDAGSYQTVWVPRRETRRVAETTYENRVSYRPTPTVSYRSAPLLSTAMTPSFRSAMAPSFAMPATAAATSLFSGMQSATTFADTAMSTASVFDSYPGDAYSTDSFSDYGSSEFSTAEMGTMEFGGVHDMGLPTDSMAYDMSAWPQQTTMPHSDPLSYESNYSTQPMVPHTATQPGPSLPVPQQRATLPQQDTTAAPSGVERSSYEQAYSRRPLAPRPRRSAGLFKPVRPGQRGGGIARSRYTTVR